jgi:ethanolamine ammonia-lyase small subunit
MPAEDPILERLKSTTPARIGVGSAGSRPRTQTWLDFRLAHAMAKDAVKSEFSEAFLDYVRAEGYPIVQSTAADKLDFIAFPPKGKVTEADSLPTSLPKNRDVQIVVCDGLSAQAVEANVRDLIPMLFDGLAQNGFTCGTPVVVRFGRVAVADQIAHALGMKLVIDLVGERPGLSAADSLSAYITYNPGPHTISSDRTVVSNIHSRGTPPVEAGAYIVQLVKKIFELKVSGVKLQQIC